ELVRLCWSLQIASPLLVVVHEQLVLLENYQIALAFSVRLQQLWHALLQRPISLLPWSCACLLRRSNRSRDPSLIIQLVCIVVMLWRNNVVVSYVKLIFIC
ncbi:uncharacterized protein LOC130721388, partial [Lotus japonicus]|uniref:uncharacterized protein LOC130721388 n=1 Tax=Lotus japonicus TaxID=34305 RepID=UPI002586A780